MTVTINGTTGIAGVNGSATTPAAQGSGTNTGIFYGSNIVGVSTGGTERMRIDSSGNVGIGNSSPRVKLEASASINAPTALATAVTSGANGNLLITDNGGGTIGSQVGVALNGSSYDTYIQARNMGAASTAYNLLLQPLGGNVGIGTSSPGDKLEVAGNVRATASNYFVIGSSGSGDVSVRANGAGGFRGLGFYVYNGGAVSAASIDGNGVFAFNSGYGSVATAYGCRAWVNFNGTGTVAIRASGNVSSITDNGTGAWVVNMTNAMPDTNYAPISCGNNTAGTAAQNSMYNSTPLTTSTFTVNQVTNGGGPRDDAVVTSSVFR